MYKPSKEELGRIDLVKLIEADNNTLATKDVCDLYKETLDLFFNKTNTGKMVKAKLTVDEFIRFINGFSMSFLSTVYCSSGKDDNQVMIRKKLCETINKDILVESKIIEK